MNCICIDDNLLSLKALNQMIEQVDDLCLLGQFADALEALQFIKKNKIDLIFLDLEMPNLGGLEFADSLEKPPLIIVVTAKREFALQAYEKHIIDYLVKPVTFPRFLSAVKFAQKLFESRITDVSESQNIFVKADGRLNKVNLSEIKYIQAMGDYVRIFTPKNKFMVNKTMKFMVAHLPAERFIRVHRSYIVNVDQISNIEENMILIDKDIIPVSERYKASFLDHLNLL